MSTDSSPTASRRPLWPIELRHRAGGLLRVLGATWLLGVLVALATWNISFTPPLLGLDPSWWAALYMGADRGLHFGSELVWTYGPLGFLREPWLFVPNLAVIAFVYSAALYIALCISLVWALRRSLNAALAVILTFVALIAAPSLEVPITLAAIWCLAALSPRPPRHAQAAVLFGGATLGATETLVELRSGPVILLMCAVTLAAQPRWRRLVPAFVGCSVVGLAVAWFAAGQAAGNVGDFISSSAQIVSGYSQAMGVKPASGLYLPGAVLIGAALVAAAAAGSAAGRARIAAAIVMGVAAFSLYKEAIVRADAGHAAIFFGTAAAFAAAIAYRRRLAAVAAVAALIVVAIVAVPPYTKLDFNPFSHARAASNQAQLLVDAPQRHRLALFWTAVLRTQYRVPSSMLGLLAGRTVHVDPWEAGATFAYRLRWDPLPVFQDYSAYTSALDRLNANALRSARGPQRILRENVGLVQPQYPTATIDQRFPAWDPPDESIAMLCNYVALDTSVRWQALGKVGNRCGPATLVKSLKAHYGEAVSVPAAPPRGIVFAAVHGAGVSGLESVRSALYKAKFRYVRVNGNTYYRLVPGTAADGLLLDAATGVDYPAPFALSPGARTIAVVGDSGALRIDFYSMAVTATGR